jgi:hypothetical protein
MMDGSAFEIVAAGTVASTRPSPSCWPVSTATMWRQNFFDYPGRHFYLAAIDRVALKRFVKQAEA